MPAIKTAANTKAAQIRKRAKYAPKPLPDGSLPKPGRPCGPLTQALRAASGGRSETQMRRIWRGAGAVNPPVYAEILRLLNAAAITPERQA